MSKPRTGYGITMKSIVDAVSLIDVVLAEATMTRGNASNFTPGSADVSIISKGTLPMRGADGEPRVLLSSDSYVTELTNADEETIAKIEFTFIAAFHLEDDFEPAAEEIDAFAKSTGRLVLRPYARELIHQTCMRMGIPSYILEVLQFKGVVLSDGVEDVPVEVSTHGA